MQLELLVAPTLEFTLQLLCKSLPIRQHERRVRPFLYPGVSHLDVPVLYLL